MALSHKLLWSSWRGNGRHLPKGSKQRYSICLGAQIPTKDLRNWYLDPLGLGFRGGLGSQGFGVWVQGVGFWICCDVALQQ